MTNAELIQKIRAEIERLKGQLIRGACAAQISFETSCKDEAYNELLSFLDTLESEKPMNQEGLEEELDRFIASGKSVTVEDCGTYKVSYHDFKKVARHFAQWGAEHSGSSEIPNDLQKYASRAGFDYVDDIVLLAEPNHRWNDHDVEYAYRDGIIAGAKWQAEQYHFFNKAWAENMQAELDRNYENGKQAMKEQMLKEAVECETVCIKDRLLAVLPTKEFR